mmetsp:Transcript_66110/g.184096  ORF Transcript_66110/g.184096 Transcript_66110/m.184096 type:complete len:222 (-) Transcript_66110:240-905(-)
MLRGNCTRLGQWPQPRGLDQRTPMRDALRLGWRHCCQGRGHLDLFQHLRWHTRAVVGVDDARRWHSEASTSQRNATARPQGLRDRQPFAHGIGRCTRVSIQNSRRIARGACPRRVPSRLRARGRRKGLSSGICRFRGLEPLTDEKQHSPQGINLCLQRAPKARELVDTPQSLACSRPFRYTKSEDEKVPPPGAVERQQRRQGARAARVFPNNVTWQKCGLP